MGGLLSVGTCVLEFILHDALVRAVQARAYEAVRAGKHTRTCPHARVRDADAVAGREAGKEIGEDGLGLSLVSGVMKLHKGTLLLEDNTPGLKARLVLPVWHPEN